MKKVKKKYAVNVSIEGEFFIFVDAKNEEIARDVAIDTIFDELSSGYMISLSEVSTIVEEHKPEHKL